PNPLELEGKPLVVKDPEQEINLNIIVPEAITTSQLRILLNDKPQPLSPRATLKGSSNRYSLRDFLTLDERQPINKVSLAVTIQGREYRSEPLLLNFTPFKPNLHLLAIGTQSNLQFAMKDADDFSRLYGSQGGVAGNRLFNSIQVENLLGKDATASNISRQVEKLYTKFITGNIDSSDLLVLYISTHGFLAEDGEFRLQGNDFDASARRSTSVSYNDDILAILDRLPCKKLVLIDACHSGGISGSKASPSAVNLEIEKLNKVKKGLTTIVSSQGFEQSYEDVLWQNGAFTRCILDGLALGKADTDRNKIITIQELYAYLSKEVPAMVKKVKNQAQTPRLINNELGNVAIFVLD
ncbi:MAG: caspase family protein, partial [Bacteroidetes bacterium]